jgi:hypothetical protein
MGSMKAYFELERKRLLRQDSGSANESMHHEGARRSTKEIVKSGKLWDCLEFRGRSARATRG